MEFIVLLILIVFIVAAYASTNTDTTERQNKTEAAADFKNLFGVSHTTSLAQDLINTAYRAAMNGLKGLKDKGTDGLDFKQIAERSAEIDTAVKKLKDLKVMAEALGFTVPNEKE